MNIKKLMKVIPFAVLAAVSETNIAAETNVEALTQRLEMMQKEIDELKRQLQTSASKEEVRVVKQTIARASEWRQPDTLIHMAGYADVGYADEEKKDGSFNVGTFAPIFHYQYRDLVMLESELELEVGEDGETEIKLEYLTIDVFLNDYMTLVGGKFLSPIGQFRQNPHPHGLINWPLHHQGSDMMVLPQI